MFTPLYICIFMCNYDILRFVYYVITYVCFYLSIGTQKMNSPAFTRADVVARCGSGGDNAK